MPRLIVVVVIDDDPVVGEALTHTLRGLGCRCTLVLDATRAENALDSEHPDLLISDFCMPGRSGVEVLRAAKRFFPAVKRCLISGAIQQLDEAEFQSVQPCQLLSKPWHLEDFDALLAGLRSEHSALR